MRRLTTATAVAGVAFAVLATFATALAPGDFDPSFGTGGKFVHPLGEGARPGARVNALALQPDGKIVVTGEASESTTVVARLNPDGTLDPAFGTGGRFLTRLGAGANEGPFSAALVLQSDGKVVVGGNMANFATQGSQFLVARVNADGSGLDSSFDTDGIVLMQLGQGANPFSSVRDLLLQTDGKILAAGGARDGNNQAAVLIVRLNADGSFDSSFGNGGKVTPQFGVGANRGSGADELLLYPDGKILVGGAATDTDAMQADAVFLARLNADGKSFDGSFGNGGVVVSRLGQSAPVSTTLTALALQPDGKIVVGGYAFDAQGRQLILLARLNADGGLDSSFGTGGTIVTQIGASGKPSSQISALAIQPDGKIVAAGTATGSIGTNEVLVMRLNPDGSFDSSFATGGKFQTQLAPLFSYFGAAVLQPDGKLLAGGAVVDNRPDEHALVVRLIVDLPPSASFAAAPNPVAAGEPIIFNDSGSADPDGTILSYGWDFGDGTTGAGASASHSYAAAGTYIATLTVRDAYGLTATSSQTITVTPAAVAQPPGTPPPPSPPPSPPPDRPRPATAAVTRLRIDPPAFVAATKGGSIAPDPRARVVAAAARRELSTRRIGAVVSYRDSQPAITTFTVARVLPGRRSGRRCVKPSARNRLGIRCTRVARVPGSFSHRDRVGVNRFRFTGRVRGRALPRGSYRLSATPRAEGRTGRTVTARFRIIG